MGFRSGFRDTQPSEEMVTIEDGPDGQPDDARGLSDGSAWTDGYRQDDEGTLRRDVLAPQTTGSAEMFSRPRRTSRHRTGR